MIVKREIRRDIISAYTKMAKELYAQHREIPSPSLRLMIAQVITEHALSKAKEDITTAKRASKHKVTREVNKQLLKEKYPPNMSIPATEITF